MRVNTVNLDLDLEDLDRIAESLLKTTSIEDPAGTQLLGHFCQLRDAAAGKELEIVEDDEDDEDDEPTAGFIIVGASELPPGAIFAAR